MDIKQHIDFWKKYTASIGAGTGWSVFENGTLVHPFEGDTAVDVLERLHESLLGGSGAGSPLGDFDVRDVGDGDVVVSFDIEACGPVLCHCRKEDVGGDELSLADFVINAGILGRTLRNLDAENRVLIYTSAAINP